jgi:hypothetical protein
VQPQAAQVSPFLIAVSPVGASVQPQGFVHAPAGARAVLSLSLSFESDEREEEEPWGGKRKRNGKEEKTQKSNKKPSSKTRFKKIFETDINVGPVGYLNSPRGSVHSPTEQSLGRTITDLTPPKPPGRQGKKLLASSEEEASAADAAAAAAAGESKKGEEVKKLLVSDDPLDLSKDFPNDYRNWAAVLSQVLLTKEGNSADGAKDSLRRLMLAAHGHLAKVAAGEELIPRFHLQDPVLSAASPSASSPFPPLPFFGGKGNAPPSAFPATSATAFASSATFLNYAPCVL